MSEDPKDIYKLKFGSKFKKYVDKGKSQNRDISKLEEVLRLLVKGQTLPEKYKDHKLKGKYKDYRECHITPDWLLIYKYEDDLCILYKLGTHSEILNM